MSEQFFPWQSPKLSFTHDNTALEILNNYAKVNIQQEPKPNKSKSTGRPGINLTYESGGILVYDVKAEYSHNCPPGQIFTESPDFPLQEISESSIG
jgi:hypothetical protein